MPRDCWCGGSACPETLREMAARIARRSYATQKATAPTQDEVLSVMRDESIGTVAERHAVVAEMMKPPPTSADMLRDAYERLGRVAGFMDGSGRFQSASHPAWGFLAQLRDAVKYELHEVVREKSAFATTVADACRRISGGCIAAEHHRMTGSACPTDKHNVPGADACDRERLAKEGKQ